MVALYIGNNRVGSMADIEQFASRNQTVDLRDDTGKRIGKFVPETEPLCPWEPTLTREEIDERCKQPGKSLSEILKRLGAE